MEAETVSVADAAARFRVTERTIRNWCASGKLDAIRDRRQWHISEASVRKLAGNIPELPEAEPEPERSLPEALPETEGAVSLAIGALERQIDTLREENRNLAGQLGFAQARIQHLQEEVRLLTAGEVEEAIEQEQRPWWRRLLRH